jgi:hypothetical protein
MAVTGIGCAGNAAAPMPIAKSRAAIRTRRTTMIVRSTTAALTSALVLSLVTTIATASPAPARQHANPGYAAHAQSIGGSAGMTRHRANALRICNGVANAFSQPTFGDMQFGAYRSCMAQHGEDE